MRCRWTVRLAVSVVVIAASCALLWLHGSALSEAFGEGPPYYGRTMNMDKWSDPRPALVLLDSGVIVVSGAAWFAARRYGRGN